MLTDSLPQREGDGAGPAASDLERSNDVGGFGRAAIPNIRGGWSMYPCFRGITVSGLGVSCFTSLYRRVSRSRQASRFCATIASRPESVFLSPPLTWPLSTAIRATLVAWLAVE